MSNNFCISDDSETRDDYLASINTLFVSDCHVIFWSDFKNTRKFIHCFSNLLIFCQRGRGIVETTVKRA